MSSERRATFIQQLGTANRAMANQRMDMDQNAKKFTVQGRDTPVPVGSDSGKAGFHRPSASDRNETLTEGDPFTRRSSLSRTSPGTPILKAGKTESPPLMQDAKRKRSETSLPQLRVNEPNVKEKSKQEVNEKFLKTLEVLGHQTKALSRTVWESSNTKKEIREISARIQRLTEQLLGYEVQDLLRGAIEHQKCQQCELDNTEPKKKANLIDANTQTEAINTHRSTQTECSGSLAVTALAIDEYTKERLNKESLRQLINSEWEDTAYKETEETADKLQSLVADSDLAVFVNAKTALNSNVIRRVAERVPKIQSIIENNKPEPQKVAYIINKSEVLFEEAEGTEEAERHTFLVGLDDTDDQFQELFEIYNGICKLKDIALSKGKTKLTFIFQKVFDEVRCRKAVECALRNSGLKSILYLPPKATAKNSIPKPVRTSEAIMVERGNMTYADLLKAVRKEVKENDMENSVERVRMTKDGNLLLTMENDGSETSRVANALKKINGEKSIRTLAGQRANAVLHIKDLDAITTKQDVENAITAYMVKINQSGDVKVSSMRPSFGKTQTATAHVTREVASSLIQAGKIRIGLSNCRVRERVIIQTCYRCWGVGHLARNCNGPDRSKLCRNCGSGDHQWSACTEAPFCLVCDKTGHKSLSMACKIYRREANKS